MKLCCAVAVALLVLALCSQGQSQSAGPDECCFQYYNKLIPGGRIKDYRRIHPSCPKKAVILITVTDKKICADPEVKQVQDIMERIDNLFGTQTTRSAR